MDETSISEPEGSLTLINKARAHTHRLGRGIEVAALAFSLPFQRRRGKKREGRQSTVLSRH